MKKFVLENRTFALIARTSQDGPRTSQDVLGLQARCQTTLCEAQCRLAHSVFSLFYWNLVLGRARTCQHVLAPSQQSVQKWIISINFVFLFQNTIFDRNHPSSSLNTFLNNSPHIPPPFGVPGVPYGDPLGVPFGTPGETSWEGGRPPVSPGQGYRGEPFGGLKCATNIPKYGGISPWIGC